MNVGKSFFALSFVLIAVFLGSCRTVDHKEGYAFMAENYDPDDSSSKQVFITSTKPIDSVDVNKLIYDFYQLDWDTYPDSIFIRARVYDSLGHFVSNMADPYKKDPKAKYFTKMNEWLGKVYNVRNAPIENFRVREYGANDSIPYNIALTVDYSGSMSGVIEAIFEGTEIFVSLKQDYDKIALSSFNQKFSLKVPMTKDKNQILQLYRMKKKENFGLFSAVFDAVSNCITLFKETEPDVPRVLVVFSDGDDNYSKATIGPLIDSAKKNKIHIFSVAFGYSQDDHLRQIAKYTGGKFYKVYTKEQLIAVFRDIYMSLRNFYFIAYHPPKFWGYHKVRSYIEAPGRKDSLWAEGEYDTSDLFPWDSLNKAFTRPILFDFDSAVVKPASFPIIDEIVDAMMSRPQLKLEIQGHTDNVGKIDYNQVLSEKRAQAVLDAIVARGIEPRRLRSRGFGMSQPIAPNDAEEGRAKNRRTQFIVIAK